MQAIDAADREEWARCMRAQFSPPAMLHADASVKQDFFKPRQVVIFMIISPPPPPDRFLCR